MSTSSVTPNQQPTSALGAAVNGSDPSQVAPAQPQATATPSQPTAPAQPAQGGSRLSRIISAVANVAETALSGIPDRGRPSFVTGLGEGARAEKQQQQLQQEIKFRDLDSQIRIAQLHNQDLKMQQDTQAQKDAHIKAELDNRSLANSLGIKYDTIASAGSAVMDHLKSQTAATGSASVPPGTHLSGDGKASTFPKTTNRRKTVRSKCIPYLRLHLVFPHCHPVRSLFHQKT